MTKQAKTRLLKKLRLKFEEIDFEFTPTGNPRKNDVIEWGFATLYSWMRMMMTHAGLHENLNTGLWPKCADTMTKPEAL